MRHLMRLVLLTIGITVVAPVNAMATSISANLTADDSFSLFISTDDSLPGTLACSGTPWFVNHSCGPTALIPGVTNYVHVQANDLFGAPSGFIGTFTLSDSLFQFSNGTQTLSTNTVDWVVRVGSFADADLTPISYGSNGVPPWFFRPGISADAQWLWEASGDGCSQCTRFFSTEITPTDVAAVPEPSTLTLLGLGAAAVARRHRRRSTS